MSPIELIEDALAEGRAFADLAGRLRDKFRTGAASLRSLCDEAEGVVDGALAKVHDGLAALKAELSRVEGEAKGDGSAPAGTATPSPSGATAAVDPGAEATTHADPAPGIAVPG